MAEDNVRKAVQKSTVDNGKIKIAANDPALRGKIHLDIDDPSETIYWYIKFNIALDSASVSKKTMSVMETNGYILNTVISYDPEKNLIVLCPVDAYEQNTFYILTITTKVKSARGNNLKKDIHILFKIIGNKISEFQILKSTVKVPKPRPKPKTATVRQAPTVSKHYTFSKDLPNGATDYLPSAGIRINFLPAVFGLILIAASIPVNNFYFSILSLAVSFAGLVHVIIQVADKQIRSDIYYSIGVINFNSGKYKKAQKRFEKAAALNPLNEYAEYGLNKLIFYLE